MNELSIFDLKGSDTAYYDGGFKINEFKIHGFEELPDGRFFFDKTGKRIKATGLYANKEDAESALRRELSAD